MTRPTVAAFTAAFLLAACPAAPLRHASGQAVGQPGYPQAPDGVAANPVLGGPYRAIAPGTDAPTQQLQAAEAAAEQQAARLLKEYAKTTDERRRGELKSELSTVLEKEFDLQQQRREREATQIAEQLKQVRDLMKRRGDARQAIIDRRLDQLLREAEGLGWTPPTTRTGGNSFKAPSASVPFVYPTTPPAAP